jgi:ABC-2 type transport system permease protein
MSATPSAERVRQALLFQWLRWRLLANGLRVMLGRSAVRPVTIVLVSLVVWAFVFGVSYGGFWFVRHEMHLSLTGEIIGRIIIGLLFLALGALLVFSSGLILYGSLFASAETAFLLSKPVAADQVFAYKFQGALTFSSWAFLLLGGPILIAYGLVGDAPWPYYVFLAAFFFGFVLVPGSVGAILCLLVVNFLPRRRRQFLVLSLLLLGGLLAWWVVGVVRASGGAVQSGGHEALNRLLGRFAFARGALVPSDWVAEGLKAAMQGQTGKALRQLALVWSNGLMLYVAAAWLSARLYRRGLNRLATGGDLRRRVGGAWLDGLLERLLFFVEPRVRLLIVKDFRTFRRDPQQWGQVLIFTLLMLLYITNVRRLFVSDVTWEHQNGISLLNVAAVALLLCTYTGRFVYPLLSLEGRKFWVLGLLPLRREQLLWGKFAFATTGSVLLAGGLVVLSDVMLGMPSAAVLLHFLAIAALAVGLSGLSVGLGAWLPNFRETDPSKIAVGFGGTMNLVAGLGLLVLTLCLTVLPYHVQSGDGPAASWGLIAVLAALGAGVCVAAAAVPLRLGARALREMEF